MEQEISRWYEYKIIEARNLKELEKEIEFRSSMGWRIVGPVQISHTPLSDGYWTIRLATMERVRIND